MLDLAVKTIFVFDDKMILKWIEHEHQCEINLGWLYDVCHVNVRSM
jgi:hypothetical protein